MGVYIKGMKMPNDCYECPLMMTVFVFKGESNICSITDGGCTKGERPPHCPLVEVKPHGRLIDADALYKVIKEDDEWVSSNIGDDEKTLRTGYQCAYGRSRRMIRHAPTIIEAERENG